MTLTFVPLVSVVLRLQNIDGSVPTSCREGAGGVGTHGVGGYGLRVAGINGTPPSPKGQVAVMPGF